MLIEERRRNHADVYENGWINSVWDMVMYDFVTDTDNLDLFLNTAFYDVVMDGEDSPRGEFQVAGDASVELGYYHRPSLNETPTSIKTVVAHTSNAETALHFDAKTVIDCTGDGMVADRAGCEWRMGSESKQEFGEIHASDTANTDTMGNSIHFRCKDVGKPVPFKAPEWAMHYNDADYFYKQGRIPKEKRGGFWWLEIGVPYHTIHDNEDIRHELTRHTLGVWEWMKNKDPIMKELTQNYALDWIGQVPGKRESRRIMGEYIMTENDVQNCTVFEDEIAFGGWFVDLHTPGGLLAPTSEPSSASKKPYDTFDEYSVKSYCGPYGVPLRSCISKDVPNLMMAGRNISVSRAALGTTRVMGTTALIGQACGTAAAVGIQKNQSVKSLAQGEAISEIQNKLLRDGCFLPNYSSKDASDLAKCATMTASSEQKVAGVGPDTKGAHEGLAIWRDQPQYKLENLETRKAQLIGLGKEGIKKVSVCLSNLSDKPQEVDALIYAVDHIWDYRVRAGEPIAQTKLQVPKGEKNWVSMDVDIPGSETPSFVRIDLSANPDIQWHRSEAIIPGHMSYYQIGENKYRRFFNGETLSYKVSPAQTAFPADQIATGVTRPHQTTNLWKSDPNEPLSQYLDLKWDEAQDIATIELTFPGHLIREYHAYSPFYADAQCAKDYRVLAMVDDNWQTLFEIKDNYQRQRKHPLEFPIHTNSIRVEILNTHGDPSAAIYEVRCYGTDQK